MKPVRPSYKRYGPCDQTINKVRYLRTISVSLTGHKKCSSGLSEIPVWSRTNSFPSGHTLHAVTITLLILPVLPLLGMVLVPVTVMIMLSGIVLRLHYPTDVVVAALLGSFVASYAGDFVSL
ncbi:MAG: hypothetical protein CMD99_02565 [Gammaproteobacteria bacterium]|nr:hypothetical protein [Gammaproteobacteria bacterium]